MSKKNILLPQQINKIAFRDPTIKLKRQIYEISSLLFNVKSHLPTSFINFRQLSGNLSKHGHIIDELSYTVNSFQHYYAAPAHNLQNKNRHIRTNITRKCFNIQHWQVHFATLFSMHNLKISINIFCIKTGWYQLLKHLSMTLKKAIYNSHTIFIYPNHHDQLSSIKTNFSQ